MKYQNLDFDTIPGRRERARIRNFENQWGLASIQAQRAYAHVELIKGSAVDPGDGVTIGFVDSGIDRAHDLFEGANIDTTFLLGASAPDGTRFSHGTAVASVAAAPLIPRFTNSSHGVAYGADIAMFAIPTGTGPAVYNPVSLASLSTRQTDWTTIINSALGWRNGTRAVDFLNLSVGISGIIENYSTSDLRTHFATPVAAMAQSGTSEKTILVWAAGNAHGKDCNAGTDNCENGMINASSVEIYPGLVARFPELQGHMVAVVATSRDGAITDFSNRCGIAADWCLAAPGDNISVAYYGPKDDQDVVQDGFRGIATVGGTSFSVPMVGGGLAVMKHLFRNQLSNTALLARLLATANDSGRYANRSVYGHGLMDLGAATSPVGVLEVMPEQGTGTSGASLQTTWLQASPAFGDALAHSLHGHELAAFDDLGAPFWFDLAAFARPAARASMNTRLADFARTAGPDPAMRQAPGTTSPWRLGLVRLPGADSGQHLALAGRAVALDMPMPNGLSARAFTTEGIAGEVSATGALLSWQLQGLPVALQTGWYAEHDTLLASQAHGAFGRLGADTLYLGVVADTTLADWTIGGRAEFGRVQSGSDHGLITRVAPLVTSSFAAHAHYTFANTGTLHLSMSQPLRVEAGHARLEVPVGRSRGGEILHRPVRASLVPSGRQVDVAARWFAPADVGQWGVGATWSHEPLHRKSADPEFTLLGVWQHTF